MGWGWLFGFEDVLLRIELGERSGGEMERREEKLKFGGFGREN